jgi:hypothetical protein
MYEISHVAMVNTGLSRFAMTLKGLFVFFYAFDWLINDGIHGIKFINKWYIWEAALGLQSQEPAPTLPLL